MQRRTKLIAATGLAVAMVGGIIVTLVCGFIDVAVLEDD